jgi:membrane glycosyltransferase
MLQPLDLVLLALFVVLFTWVVFSFWAAWLGYIVTLAAKPTEASKLASAKKRQGPLPRTVVLVPVYNEDPAEVFAGLGATCESLMAAGVGESVDIFILSDTRDPRIWLQEQRAWTHLASSFAPTMGIHYRRRMDNSGKKAGNIAEFCRRWGRNYKYMVIFDADSVMSGSTIAELIRRMEARPDVGIMQAPPLPVGRESLFARLQQFSASAYGDIYAAGLAAWSQVDANYYGHNAILRVAPFIQHCMLPRLPGRPPLGGEILSHDFVEAAMMRRAGWKVVLAEDLTGSYEQCPTTLVDFAARDQRWCQGNLQHMRIAFRSGLHPVSRIHLISGVMSYLAAPLWLAFVLTGLLEETLRTIGWIDPGGAEAVFGRGPIIWLLVVTMAMLLLPKFLALTVLERDPLRLVGHGGQVDATISACMETAISVLIAPIMMMFHTRFVLATFTGQKVSWGAQRRGEVGMTWPDALRIHGGHMVVGLGLITYAWFITPGLFWWLMPITVGLVLSPAIEVALSSVKLGRSSRLNRLLLIPDELIDSPILRRRVEILGKMRVQQARDTSRDLVSRVVLSPTRHNLHLSVLQASREHAGAPAAVVPRSAEELDVMTDQQLMALLCDEQALRRLHDEAWTSWPVEQLVARAN